MHYLMLLILFKNDLETFWKKLRKNLWLHQKGFYICIRNWRNGRVVECGSLENC